MAAAPKQFNDLLTKMRALKPKPGARGGRAKPRQPPPGEAPETRRTPLSTVHQDYADEMTSKRGQV